MSGMALLVSTEEAITYAIYVFNEVEKMLYSRNDVNVQYLAAKKEIEQFIFRLKDGKKTEAIGNLTKNKSLTILAKIEKHLLEKILRDQHLDTQFTRVAQEELFAIIIQRANSISSRR